MRVPNISLYSSSQYRLGGLTSNLNDANEVMATQKRINSLSDDPIGLSQVLDLKLSIGNLDQIEKNVNMGISWLSGTENGLDSANGLILEAKTQVSRLINASLSANERKDAIESVNGIMEQIIALGNTQINGNYIFSGTDTDILPLEHLKDGDPPRVVYNGNNDPFEIKTDKEVKVPVGRDGKATFWNDTVAINSTNNTIVFKEDNGHGSASEIIMEASIEFGEYSPENLEKAIRNALNETSSEQGYGITYAVEYDVEHKTFSIREDGSHEGFIRTEFMWDTGENAYVTQIGASPSINSDDIDLTVTNEQALTIDTPEPHGTEPFRLTWNGDGTWEVDNNPGYVIFPYGIPGRDDYIGIDLNESGTPDIEIALDNPVTRRGQYIEFEIVSAKGDHSLGHEIGFNGDNTIYAPPTSDNQAVYITDLIITDGVNDQIDFVEVDGAGIPSAVLTADINATAGPVTYTDMDLLSADIEAQMEAASVNGINYAVSYDAKESRFLIREDGSSLNELQVLWSNSPAASATASTLGYYPQDDIISYAVSPDTAQMYITIDSTNNRMAFAETSGVVTTPLWADVAHGTYKTSADLEAAVKAAMETASAASGNAVIYDVSYDDAANRFSIQHTGGALTGLDLLWGTAAGTVDRPGSSIGDTLGFSPSNLTGGGLGAPYTGDEDMVLMEFDTSNNMIDFEEVSIDGTVSQAIGITIPEGEYTDLNDVAVQIETALRDASPHGVAYAVQYDYPTGEFLIKGSDAGIKGFSLLWQTGENRDRSAADLLGFYGDEHVSFSESDAPVVNITIDATNNVINFNEMLGGQEGKDLDELTARIKVNAPNTSYTSHSQLALEIEKALEEESYQNGNRIDYSVSWDDYTQNFTIKENGTRLAGFNLLWASGENAPLSAGGTGESIGEILGFDIEDDTAFPVESEYEVEWGIFNTLIDMNSYLSKNDTDGLERTLGRLEAHFNKMTSQIVDIGIKYSRLEIREKITTENSLSMTERRSNIEDADAIEAFMNLESIKTAYQAALSSTSKVISLSLVDYL